jgi:hypothetical protein
VYEVDGREFIVLPVGGYGMLRFGSDKSQSPPGAYLAFALPAK